MKYSSPKEREGAEQTYPYLWVGEIMMWTYLNFLVSGLPKRNN